MSDKLTAEREAFGPRPERRGVERHEMKFRPEIELYRKLVALRKIEEKLWKLEDPKGASTVSENAQLQHILSAFIDSYESRWGPLPPPDDEAALAKCAKARVK